MKKFDKLVIRSFMGPYLLSFFVAEFVLVMQFLWKYIDDILGKGFGLVDLLELILYFMVTQIPMALPIAILISSVMVFGNMSERYELSSMKSAGVSLMRIMRPGIMIAIGTALLSLLASNYLKPQANFKFQKRFRAIQSQKPSLTIEEKIFNKDFKGFSIRIDSKNEDGEGINDVLMYDHTKNDKSLLNFIKSKSGRMYTSDDGNYFVMELYDGTQYSELQRKRAKKEKRKKYPFMRTQFEEWRKPFDLGEFETDDDGVRINRSKEDMLNTFQLLQAIDSVDQKQVKLYKELFEENLDEAKDIEKEISSKYKNPAVVRQKNSKGRMTDFDFVPVKKDTSLVSILQILPVKNHKRIVNQAVNTSGKLRDQLRSTDAQLKSSTSKRGKYLLRLNQMYAFSLICIVFMFIGGPLGSIIRKGGYGYPLLFAILFYMLFIIMTIMGEKLVRSSQMDPIVAAWFSNILVIPIAVILSYMALKDLTWKSISLPSLRKSVDE